MSRPRAADHHDDQHMPEHGRRHRRIAIRLVSRPGTKTRIGRRFHGRYTPSVDYDAFRAVLEALEREQVRYVVFGAGAMNLLGLARLTEDLDIFVAPTESRR